MATDNEQQSPFTRPAFIAATVVLAAILVLGLIIAIVNVTRDDPDPTPPTSASVEAEPTPPTSTSVEVEPTTAAPTSEAPNAAGDASICGLDGIVLDGAVTVAVAPDAQWKFQGTVGYPTSDVYGPGITSPEGVRSCFQHSPTGALFMAANAVAQGSDASTAEQWISEALADGPYRDELLAPGSGDSSSEGTRLSIAGFRILHYDGETARVDVGTEFSGSGRNITASGVYELVWQNGDWKISSDVQAPFDFAMIPNLAGYVAWGSN